MPGTDTFSLPPHAAVALAVPIEQLCARAGIALGGNWTTAEFFRLWTEAEDCTDDRAAGLRFGAGGIAGGYGVAGIVALHAPDLRAALAALGRYKRLTCPELVEVACEGEEVHVRYLWIQATGVVPRLLTDMTLAALYEMVRQGTDGKFAPRRVELARRPADTALLSEHFGCPVVFGADRDAMVFDRSALSARFVTADGATFSRVLTGLESRLNEGAGYSAIVGEVRLAIAGLLGEGRGAVVAAVARRLRVSARTLQRRLSVDGTNFQQQLAGVRRTLSHRFLAETDLDVVAVAMLLGFVELNSFTRTFRRWECTTPARWRAQYAKPQEPLSQGYLS